MQEIVTLLEELFYVQVTDYGRNIETEHVVLQRQENNLELQNQ